MEATFSKAEIFKGLMQAVNVVLEKATFYCTPEGLLLQAMDSSNVALVVLKLCLEGFKKYTCDESFTIGIDMASLITMLDCVRKSDILTIKAKPKEDLVLFVVEDVDGNAIRKLGMKLVHPDPYVDVPEHLDYCSVLQMQSSEFHFDIHGFSKMGSTVVKISTPPNAFQFEAKSVIGSQKVVYNAKRKGFTVRNEEFVAAPYSTRYLEKFSKAYMVGKVVTLSVGIDIPMAIEFQIQDAMPSTLTYYLAPKVEDDEEEVPDEN